MAKFTASVPLNMRVFPGYEISGAAGATHRIPDAYADEFARDYGANIPGFSWVQQDEATSVVTLPIAQTDVTGLTAALAAKYDKTGGTISGAVTVTGALIAQAAATVAGNLIAQSAATVAGALVAQGSQTVANALTVGGNTNLSAALGVTGAVNVSSTLGVTGKVTLLDRVAWGGSSFPGSPSNDDLFYRTDKNLLFYFDGPTSRWQSVDLFYAAVPLWAETNAGLSATTTAACRVGVPDHNQQTDILLAEHYIDFFVSGGTALSASHKWVGTFDKVDTSNAATTIVTDTIDSGSSSVWRRQTDTINALLGTTSFVFQSSWTKTGTPGNLLVLEAYSYRIVAT